MKDSNFNKIVIGAALILAAILMMSSCESHAEYHPDCPVCGECYASEEHLNAHCATNFESGPIEGCVLTAPVVDPLLATKCQTCGINFTHPSYGEHIKTCCP